MRLAVLLLVLAACDSPGWVGVDRANVACSGEHDGHLFQRHATCIGGGRMFRCVRDDGPWQCVEVNPMPERATAP